MSATAYVFGTAAVELAPEHDLRLVPGCRPQEPVGRGARRHGPSPSAAPSGCRVAVPSLPPTLVALAVSAVILLGAFSVGSSLEASAGIPANADVPTASVVVSSGDSLWTLAQEHPVSGYSTSQTVRYIESSNSLGSATITPGQTLRVPR
ncbi:MAG: LysM peptidoglycan-binding domain-containing protein [Atopobiaceae bacterium]|nr:LysM peptidoglycan-binding domain-containing protein [Atopobiaceae bacterium]